MIECKICNREFKWITYHHLRTHGLTKRDYLNKFPFSTIISEETSKKIGLISKERMKRNGNPSKKLIVRRKISSSIKNRWEEGVYRDRINGMIGMKGELHPNFKKEKRELLYLAKERYNEFLSKFEDVSLCKRCGSVDREINIHHIDEDRNNFLPSNLESLCVPCHMNFHYKLRKGPFLTIGKSFTFAAAHRLPGYIGNCQRWHGHEWKIEVRIKKRVDNKTGMVMDFSLLKKIVNDFIIEKLDHNVINGIIKNPTAENILIWAWNTLMFKAHLKGIEEILLWETPTSYSSLTKRGMLSMLVEDIEDYVVKYQRRLRKMAVVSKAWRTNGGKNESKKCF